MQVSKIIFYYFGRSESKLIGETETVYWGKKKKKLWKGLQTERNIKPHLHVISEMGTPHLTSPLVGWTPYKYI